MFVEKHTRNLTTSKKPRQKSRNPAKTRLFVTLEILKPQFRKKRQLPPNWITLNPSARVIKCTNWSNIVLFARYVRKEKFSDTLYYYVLGTL